MTSIPGRPSKRPTATVIKRICDQIRAGTYPHVAAAAAGIAPSQFDDWMRIGSGPNPPKLYADAHEAVTAAVAEMETKAVTSVLVGMADDWKAAAWWLERSRPSVWGKGTTRRTKSIPNQPEDLTPEPIQNAGVQKQHVEEFKKILLRKRLMIHAIDGACYVPFIGDADIATEIYTDRKIYGADIKQARVDIARTRLPGADIRLFDCDEWPFSDIQTEPTAIADFDAFNYPYHAFRAFMEHGNPCDTLVCFFTDGARMPAQRLGIYTDPAGIKHTGLDIKERRIVNNLYWPRIAKPWLMEWAKANGWKVITTSFYLRDRIIYWGTVLKR